MKLFSVLMFLVIYAASLAPIQTMAEEPRPGDSSQATYQLAGADRRVSRDSERSSRPKAIVAGESDPNPDYKAGKAKGSVRPKTQDVDHDCPCGPDCTCPAEIVCKNKDCKRNYAIFFTATWCKPCRTMYPRIKELRAAGYIVYTFDSVEYKAAAEEFEIAAFPTIVVMDKGKEVTRFVGVVDTDTLAAKLKKKDDQTEPDPVKPTDTDYDFRP